DLLWLVGLPITEIVNHHAGSMTVYIYLRVDIPVNFVGIRQGQAYYRAIAARAPARRNRHDANHLRCAVTFAELP
ncbi:MAG: hypothetical protein ACREXM_18405, partial [Gammaproteobacteria bacterium]